MQSEVSVLPIVQLNSNKILDRKPIRNAKNSPVRIKDQSLYKSATCMSIGQKNLQSGLGGPYKNSIRLNTHPLVQSNPTKSACKNYVGQRVLSARMLRLKQLQNQLADAHYHLNELSNENRLLKALHKRQDSALKHYEGTNAELPRIINSHYEELRALQAKYKRLKILHKETCMLLKEKGSELQSLRLQNKHLLQLSKDRNLGEREKLQSQVTDLNFKIQQQQEIIQVLQRKLAVDTKSTKQQLRLEISKHKETKINLHEAVERIRQMEYFLDTRTKRLYRNSQIPRYVKEKRRECQSLTNLRVISGVSNFSTVTNAQKKNEHGIQNINLPALSAIDPNDAERDTQTIDNIGCERTLDSPKSETMTNLHEIRQFRLKKLECNLIVPLEDDLEEEEYETKLIHDGDIVERPDTSKSCGLASREADNLDQCNLQNKFNDVKDLSYASDDTVSEHTQEDLRLHDTSYHSTKKSRELHAKLVQSASHIVELGTEQNEKNSIYENEKEFEAVLKELSEFSIDKYKIAATVLAQNCERQSSTWNSALECTMKNDIQIDDDSVKREITNLHSIIGERDTVKSFVNSCQGDLQNNMDIHLSTAGGIGMHKNSSENIDNLPHNPCDSSLNLPNTSKTWDVHHNDVMTNSICNECHENFSEGCNFCTKKIEFKDKSSLTQCINKKHLKEDLCNDTTTFKEQQNTENAHQLCASSFSNNDPEKNLEQATNESLVIKKNKNQVAWKNSDFRNVRTVQQELTVMHNSTLAEQPLTRNDQCIFDLSKQVYCMKNENTNSKDNTSKQQKPIRYNKEKLLATMKAIDNNENIQFLDQEFR